MCNLRAKIHPSIPLRTESSLSLLPLHSSFSGRRRSKEPGEAGTPCTRLYAHSSEHRNKNSRPNRNEARNTHGTLTKHLLDRHTKHKTAAPQARYPIPPRSRRDAPACRDHTPSITHELKLLSHTNTHTQT